MGRGIKREGKSPCEWQALLAKKEEEITALQRQVDWLSQQLRLTPAPLFTPFVETAKVNGLRPYRYLKFLLERLSAGVPADECFPWNAAVENLCK